MVDQTNVPDGDVITSDETEDVNAAAHEARLKYEIELDRYEKFARSIAEVLRECLEERRIKTQSISYRAKNPDEFERKAARPMPGSITAKYSDPLAQITDKAGVRVITYFLRSVGEVADVIDDEFEVIENAVKAAPHAAPLARRQRPASGLGRPRPGARRATGSTAPVISRVHSVDNRCWTLSRFSHAVGPRLASIRSDRAPGRDHLHRRGRTAVHRSLAGG